MFFLIITYVYITGTPEERGITKWRKIAESSSDKQKTQTNDSTNMAIYDLPLIQKYLDKLSWPRYIPFCPTFDTSLCCRSCKGDKKTEYNSDTVNKAYEADKIDTAL